VAIIPPTAAAATGLVRRIAPATVMA